MSAQLAAHGRLGGDPRTIETKTGRAMVTATLAVDAPDKREGDDAPPLWLGIVAFGTLADRLLEHRKGDALTVYGRLQVRRWQSDGEAREQLQVVIETLLSARTVAQREGGPTSPQRDLAPVEP
jgi:single-strand DNA-binding protein